MSDQGVVSSRGQDPGADLVHIQAGCTVSIFGLVESTGVGHVVPSNPPNSCDSAFRPDTAANSTTCVEIWAGNSLTIDGNAPHHGEVNADHTGQCGAVGWIDVFARGPVNILGPASGKFAVHANANCATNQQAGTVRVKSAEKNVVASGLAIAADAQGGGSNGGFVTVEGATDVTLNLAKLEAIGDANATGGFGKGGKMGSGNTAGIRAFGGTVTWKSGVGDVRPTGTVANLAAASRGEIVLQQCTAAAVDLTGTTFPPGTPFTPPPPVQLGTSCVPGPSLPSYVTLPTCLCETITQDCPHCSGEVVTVTKDVTVDFNAVPPTCNDGGSNTLCAFFTADKSGPTPDTWKAIFDLKDNKLVISANVTVSTTAVPNIGNNRATPGIVIKGTCELVIQGAINPGDTPGMVLVQSNNKQAGDILIQFEGAITIDGIVRNQVVGTLGRPGKITIGSCCGDINTGPASRIETIGVDPGGNDINIATCCERGYGGTGGDIDIEGLVMGVHKTTHFGGKTPTINIASFVGSVTINGTHDFGLESNGDGSMVRRTSGVLVRDITTTDAGNINIQALTDVNVIGNWLFPAGQNQFGAVAIKPRSTNGLGGNGAITVVALTGKITATDRAFDFLNRFNKFNSINLSAASSVDLSVTAAKDDGAATNAKPVIEGRGLGGQGDTNRVRSYSSAINIDANAQVFATGLNVANNGSNQFTSCTGVNNLGTVDPAASIGSSCAPSAPSPLFTSCSQLGIFFADNVIIGGHGDED